MRRKPDDAAIGAFFDDLARQPWLGPERQRWPDFLFHITDVRNAASILHMGRLLSRARAIELGVMANDQAAPSIIQATPPRFRHHARLYFRPRTPTMYRNEGIRPTGDPAYGGAHCPMPVALLFDARFVAGMPGVMFTDRSAAHSLCRTGDGAGFLRSLRFQDIYNQQPFGTEPKHAEALVPDELSIEALRHVFVRTPAERQTLLRLLAETGGLPAEFEHLRTSIRVNVEPDFFFRRWTSVETVQAVGDLTTIRFNASAETPGPFIAVLSWEGLMIGGRQATT